MVATEADVSLVFSSIVKVCLAAVLILILAPSLARAQLFTLSSITGWWDYDPSVIRQVNPATGETISFLEWRLPAGTYGMYTTGLATHPTTGEFFLLVQSAPRPRHPCRHNLTKINPATGNAAVLGNTGACFASLAFHSNGTLYGATHREGSVPPALFTLNTRDAKPTFLMAFDTVDECTIGGPGLAFNPNDGLLYLSGCVGISDLIFQSINPDTLAITDIPLSGSFTAEIIALTHSFENTLLGADVSGQLVSITTTGVRTLSGSIDHLARGLAFATTLVPPPVPLNIGATMLATAEAGTHFIDDLRITGGMAPYVVSITNGRLPAGLSAGNDGIISGVLASTARSGKVTLRITDSLNESRSKTFTISVVKAVSIVGKTKPGRVGKAYRASLKSRGGQGPFSWSITAGALPDGLSFDSSAGVISGIPSEAGEFPLTVQVIDGLGGTDSENLTLTIK